MTSSREASTDSGSAVASPAAALAQEASDQEASDHEASDHEALDHEASDQDASDHDADAQDADAQDADAHDADAHEADAHEADAHDAFDAAVEAQLAWSNTGSEPPAGSAVTNGSSAAFGFGGDATASAPITLTSPTPIWPAVFFLTASADSIRAPFTWLGVQPGCCASSAAATPATTGAANEVPDSCA
jgi:hypothetical protein